MKKAASVLFPVLLACCAEGARLEGAQTALDRYVAQPDPVYRYEAVSTIPGDGVTTTVLELTSQKWCSEAEVDRPIWKHWLTIVRPAVVKSSIGLLFISGGNNHSKPPAAADARLVSVARTTGTVAAELRMVPNQPLTFTDDKRPRVEDQIIAYTWNKYLRTGDETWPLRLPMTKSAVRSMDAITAFCRSTQGGGVSVDKFVVAGGSKRGWTTWTTAAVDRRVIAIAPLVIDLLNIEKSFEHHYRVYGFWAPAVHDYEQERIMDWSGTPEYHNLMKIEEPYEYRHRLTMPKYMINATGDQFFLPDSSQFYWNHLKGEKHIRYVPNANHSLAYTDARDSLQAFYEMILSGTPRPEYTWKFENYGGIRFRTKTKPIAAKLWQASNPKARDFRLETIGSAWKATPLEADSHGVYHANPAKPREGYTAYFIEVTYPGLSNMPLKVTSGVRVIPDVLPFAAYEPKPVR